jgi:hypothetical protein
VVVPRWHTYRLILMMSRFMSWWVDHLAAGRVLELLLSQESWKTFLLFSSCLCRGCRGHLMHGL